MKPYLKILKKIFMFFWLICMKENWSTGKNIGIQECSEENAEQQQLWQGVYRHMSTLFNCFDHHLLNLYILFKKRKLKKWKYSSFFVLQGDCEKKAEKDERNVTKKIAQAGPKFAEKDQVWWIKNAFNKVTNKC